jgi:magnesium-transporting ATPase (P-type)
MHPDNEKASTMVPALQALADFFSKKQVWMAIALLAFLFLKTYWPEVPLTEETIQSIVIALAMGLFGIQFTENSLLLKYNYHGYHVLTNAMTAPAILTKIAAFFANKQVWITFAMVIFILLKSFWPEMPITEETIRVAMIAIAVSVFGIEFVENAFVAKSERLRLIRTAKMRS